jgi:transposase
MRALTIPDAETVVLGLQDEIRRSEEARYDHRLHGVLLVAEGLTCRQVASLLGDSPGTVGNWVHRFSQRGLGGLAEGDRPGRPTRLNPEQLREIDQMLRGSPREAGLEANLWDGPSLAALIEQRYGLSLGVRQCQRLFRKLNFRLRKPRPEIARADPELQAAAKKDSRA